MSYTPVPPEDIARDHEAYEGQSPVVTPEEARPAPSSDTRPSSGGIATLIIVVALLLLCLCCVLTSVLGALGVTALREADRYSDSVIQEFERWELPDDPGSEFGVDPNSGPAPESEVDPDMRGALFHEFDGFSSSISEDLTDEDYQELDPNQADLLNLITTIDRRASNNVITALESARYASSDEDLVVYLDQAYRIASGTGAAFGELERSDSTPEEFQEILAVLKDKWSYGEKIIMDLIHPHDREFTELLEHDDAMVSRSDDAVAMVEALSD